MWFGVLTMGWVHVSDCGRRSGRFCWRCGGLQVDLDDPEMDRVRCAIA